MPDWDDFRLLMTVIKMGSFNRAADAMGLTQPTVSRRIANHEEAMGARIVDRSSAGATLTQEGQRLFDELNIAHAALERAVKQTQAKQAHREEIKLVVTDGLAAYWLTHFLPMLYDLHPELELRIFTANDSTGERHGHYDMSIHFLAPSDPDMIALRLGTLHFMPYASQAYLAAKGHPASLADFANHRLLDYVLYLVDKGSWVTRLPGGMGQDRTQLFTNSSAVLGEAVRKGAGIALLPTYGSVFEEGVVPIDVGLQLETPFWLCYRQDVAMKSSVRTMVQFLRHVFDRKTMPWFAERFVSPERFPKVTVEGIMDLYGAKPFEREPTSMLFADKPLIVQSPPDLLPAAAKLRPPASA
jgi:molybdate transport repressor ModE-like protein